MSGTIIDSPFFSGWSSVSVASDSIYSLGLCFFRIFRWFPVCEDSSVLVFRWIFSSLIVRMGLICTADVAEIRETYDFFKNYSHSSA